MSAMLCTGPTFVKKNSCRLNNAGFHVLISRILEPFPPKDIELDLSHLISH